MGQFELGFVYVMQNEAMPGLVKIGMTTRLAENRAQELFTTGMPKPFEVVFRALTSNPAALEEEVHKQLKDRRVKTNREFFSVSSEDAITAILSARRKVDGIVKWTGKTPLLRDGDRLLLSMRAGQLFVIYAYPFVGAAKAEIVDIWQAHTDNDIMELYCTENAEYSSGFSDNDQFSDRDPVPFLNRTGTAHNDTVIGRERLVPGDRLLWVDDTGESIRLAGPLFEVGCYCQVVARTRQPLFLDNWIPLLITDVTREAFSQEVHSLAQFVHNMPPPRNWAPRIGGGEWVKAAEQEASAEFWLRQLEERKKAKKNK